MLFKVVGIFWKLYSQTVLFVGIVQLYGIIGCYNIYKLAVVISPGKPDCTLKMFSDVAIVVVVVLVVVIFVAVMVIIIVFHAS